MAKTEAHFTREGYERLKQELEDLKTQRIEIRQEIKEAREQGDLRENFAYHAARETQGIIEARINSLESRLEDAVILEKGATLDSVVLGVPVTVRPVGDGAGDERVYTIVATEELEHVEDAASEESPIGQALLGKKVGDIAEVQGPRGIVRFEIVSIGA
ncbi:MAG: transcription elongation factor GreA [Abitibacteriaceae bacterium]|nr:transcription elongation factor GreA [Abditibacteriaceae bacterium]MBV9864494.1 transcription elongation factor GreA [Abditibacteriaceae bacterium]